MRAGRRYEDRMDTFITISSAATPLGIPTGRKCFIVPSGRYANRLAVIYAASAGTIKLTWADPPYQAFSTPVNVVTDSADLPFDAFLRDTGDIYLAYTIATNLHLGFVKLTFSDGTWSAGTPVTVYDGDESRYPSICRLSTGYLWIAYTRISGGSHYISAKASSDDGADWGTVTNPGDTLTSGASSAWCTMLESGYHQYVFYSEGGAKVAYRRKLNAGIIWDGEVILASGSGLDEDLSAGKDIDGRIGLAYASASGLKFREYSGSVWSAEYVLDTDTTVSRPIVSYQGGIPYVVFTRVYGTGMNLVFFTKKAGVAFQSPAPLDDRKSYLQKLLVYDASAGTYQDKTVSASSPETADVYHSTSGALIAAVNDAVYIGMEAPFHFIRLILSTAGIGGEVAWKYWDGQSWQSFTPASGAWHFTTGEKDFLPWNDYSVIPGDWQKKTISDQTLYWIAAVVTSAFTTPPVGTQITTISRLEALCAQV